MEKPNTVIYIALVIVVVGLVFQFMEMGVFGEDPCLGYRLYESRRRKKKRIAKKTCDLNNNLFG